MGMELANRDRDARVFFPNHRTDASRFGKKIERLLFQTPVRAPWGAPFIALDEHCTFWNGPHMEKQHISPCSSAVLAVEQKIAGDGGANDLNMHDNIWQAAYFHLHVDIYQAHYRYRKRNMCINISARSVVHTSYSGVVYTASTRV